MANYSRSRKHAQEITWAMWGASPGAPSGALGAAAALGGQVERVDALATAPAPEPQRNGGNGTGGGGSHAPAAAATGGRDDCHALVVALLDDERVREAAALDALGDRRQAREVREDLFVRLLAAWCDCAGAVPVNDVVSGLAYLLRVSPATTKRYLRAHASPFAEFALDGDFVVLRGGGR